MRPLLTLLIVLGLGLNAAPAAARKRAVLLPFTGPGAAAVRTAVFDAFRRQGRVEVLRPDALYSAARRLGIARRDLRDPVSLSIVAAEIRADAVVRGTTSRAGRRSSLSLKVYSGGTGRLIGSHTVSLTRGRADKAVARRVIAVAIPTILKGSWRPADRPSGRSRARARRRAPAGAEEPAGRASARRPVPAEPLAPLATEPPPPVVRRQGPAAPPPRAEDLLVEVGLIGLSRSYRLDGGLTEAGQPLPHRYESGLYPGAWLRGEVYPFALSGEKGTIRGVGLEGYFDLGHLESELRIVDDDGDREVTRVGTTQQMWGVGLVLRLFPARTAAGIVALRLLAGYHGATFALEQRTSLYQRNDYAALRLGGDVLVPISRSGEWTCSLRGRLAALWARSALNELEAYPAATGLGWELAGGLDVDLGRGLALAADVRRYSFPAEFEPVDDSHPSLDSEDTYLGYLLQVVYRAR